MVEKVGSKEYQEGEYSRYQSRYRSKPPERDEKLLTLLRALPHGDSDLRLLDIGCHQGNLLALLRSEFPTWRLWGGDIWPKILEDCRQDPDLEGIHFEHLDVLSLPSDSQTWDVIIANAVLFRFDEDEFERAIQGIGASLGPGGVLVAFDWYHDFRQRVVISEFTPQHPEGLLLNMRDQAEVTAILQKHGFCRVEFHPFNVDAELPLREEGDALHTHTKTLNDGTNISLRGVIFQPWCHLVAVKG